VLKRKVQIQKESIENVVNNKDYKKALVEYILNAFEADATEVSVVSSVNELGGLEEITITDNGTGIHHENLEQTFESFLTSTKQVLQKPINIGRNEGKGRYSFIGFSNSATWHTVFTKEGRYFSHDIRINASTKDHFFFDESPKDVTDEITKTGTTVILNVIDGLLLDFLQIERSLQEAFAPFLYLNKSKDYKITVDGIALDYLKHIDAELSEDKEIAIDGQKFSVYFIKWINSIKSKYYFHFLDESSVEKYNKHTKFNNNALEFYHSVYIESNYFNDFIPLNDSNTPDEQGILGEEQTKNQRTETFKKLLKSLKEFVASKQKEFVKKDANRLVDKIESADGFPNFEDTALGLKQKEYLVSVVKEIHCVEPRIFKKLKKEPQKSILGFLNLLLATDERENIVKIIDEITQLTQQERADLAAVLQFTKLTNVIRTTKLITDRLRVIQMLRLLIYDNKKFANERDHIQKVITENYWLFGEEFYLVTADKNFEQSLSEYLYIIDGDSDKRKYSIKNPEKLRRPDIFICQKRKVDNLDGSQLEQNIIVELKSPQVVLNKKVYRQIEDYMDLIIKEPEFNSVLRAWRFIVICKSIDEDVQNIIKSQKIHNKRFLTKRIDDYYEIYAMTWDDVFKSYELRYDSLLKELKIDNEAILNSIEHSEASKETANRLRDEILHISNQGNS